VRGGSTINSSSARMLVVRLPLGARLWLFMDCTPQLMPDEAVRLADYPAAIPRQLCQPPKALVVSSAHREEPSLR
jgi:hypothetical protein